MTEEPKRNREAPPVTRDLLDSWATDPNAAVALHLKQRLLPVAAIEGDQGIVFPPTYTDIGYNLDTLSDGRRVATIDSVGSQANRMEPLFKKGGPLADLVPQLEIKVNDGATISIFDLAHRAADATVQSSPTLAPKIADGFKSLQKGNAVPLCALAPTSLVFGVWDSRGESGEKRPRLVRSVIRAWDVEVLHAAAQFNSVWKKLDEEQRKELEKEAKQRKVDLSVKGLADAPATFRKTKAQQYRDGVPNPEARVLGGVLATGGIDREVTVNLVALRGLRGESDVETKIVRQYLLGLALLAATEDIDLFLREGCHLRHASRDEDAWYAVPRRGDPEPVAIPKAHGVIRNYAETAGNHFRSKWPKDLSHEFSIKEAKRLLAKKGEGEGTPGGQ